MKCLFLSVFAIACGRSGPPDDSTTDDPGPTGAGATGGAGANGGTGGAGGSGGSGGTGGVAEGELILSEVVDHQSSAQVKFIEVYNPGSSAVSLTGWSLVRYSNGGTEGVDVPLGTGEVAAGGAYVIVNLDGAADFEGLFGFPPDWTSDEVNGNGNDAWALAAGGVNVDVYGEIGVDGVGTAWDYTDSVATRNDGVNAPTTTWSAAEWTVSSGADSASPGSHPSGGGGGTGGAGGAGGGGGSGGATGTVPPVTDTIYDVQSGAVPVDTDVTVAGVVTGLGDFGFFVQDSAGGENSGVWAYLGGDWNVAWGALDLGDRVVVTAKYTEYESRTELTVDDASAPYVAKTSSGAPLAATPVSLSSLIADPEGWEGVLIEVGPVVVSVLPSADTFWEWTVADPVVSDLTLLINDTLYEWPDALTIDQEFSAITGPLNYTFGAFKLEPRDASDFDPT